MKDKPDKWCESAAKMVLCNAGVLATECTIASAAKTIMFYQRAERELLRELAEINCYSMTNHVNGVYNTYPCGECLPCRARKLLETNEA